MKQIAILPVSLSLFLFCISQPFKCYAQLKTDTYLTSNSFTAPAGVTTVNVKAWGAGGGGASRSGSGNGGGGGGGGAYASSNVSVTPGTSYPIVVGTGGAANNSGGASSFNVTTVRAAGGTGATSTSGASGGLASNSTGTETYSGGSGGSGGYVWVVWLWDYYYSGGGGGGGGSTVSGTNASGESPGNGGTANGGAGAAGVRNTNTGNIGGIYGGGGSGGVNRAGGSGANGLVTLEYTCPIYSLTNTTVLSPICNNSSATVTLTGNLPIGTYIVTYNQSPPNLASNVTKTMEVLSAGTGTFTTNPLTGNGTTITITNLRSGSTGALGYCSNAITTNNTATVSIAAPPTITSTTPNSTCGTGTVMLSATASAGNVNWYTAASGGTSIHTGTSFTTPSISATTTYYVSATNGSCTSAIRTPVVATVNTFPNIIGTAPNSRCGTGTVTLGATASAGNVNWYTTESGGTSIHTGTSFTTLSISTTTTYYVSATNGSCTSAIRTPVVATVNTIPNTPTVSVITQPNCSLDTGSVVLNDLPTGTWTLTRNDGVKITGTGTSKTITGLNPGTYTYTVTREDTSNFCSGTGTGLYAEYFNNRTLSGPAALTRTDASVSFDWEAGNPGSPINSDNFSVRWTGKIQPCYSENYIFSTNSDDGVRLWINGVLVINNWTDHAETTNNSTSIPLVAGTKYDIVLEYYENGGQAVAQLFWRSPSQPNQIIPQGQLYSEAAGCTSTNSSNIVISTQPNCWTGDYNSDWNNPSNWLIGVPTNGIETTLYTIVPSGLINYPVISNGATSGYVKTIVLENNTTITVMDNSLRITENLKLDGKIDLEGESQLLQDLGSALDPTSSGTIQIDQQGTKDLFTYNYWASPVGTRNVLTNNTSYTVADVLKDGSIPESPTNINFLSSGYDGNPGSPGVTPISIANYWIYKYANLPNNTYSAWQQIRSNGLLLPGEGFTMKGVANTNGNVAIEQNYVFEGKPNNGDITLPISPGNDYLIGNPYPSALDADAFILDNIADGAGRADQNIINGALYFWDHFGGGSHYLADYQGGYAIYTLIGGTEAISSDTRINATGQHGSKIPQRYIPVAQGFFVSSIIDPTLVDAGLVSPVVGGNITFKNSQRAFITEGSNQSLFIKHDNKKSKATASEEIDGRQKIRLMFDSPQGYHRQLLVGVDERASNAFDLGFDAPLIEANKEDMFWIFNNKQFIIQAVNNFDKNQIFPLGIKVNKQGISKIKIDALENIAEDFNIYLNDKELGIEHPINESPYEVYLAPGDYLNRFEITFKSSDELEKVEDVIIPEIPQTDISDELQDSTGNTEELGVEQPIVENPHEDDYMLDDSLDNSEMKDNDSVELEDAEVVINKKLQVYFSNETQSIIIHNPSLKQVQSVVLMNLLGQSIQKFNKASSENYIEYKTKPMSTGIYLIKVQTPEGSYSKKILMK